jgi:hypothetical protein
MVNTGSCWLRGLLDKSLVQSVRFLVSAMLARGEEGKSNHYRWKRVQNTYEEPKTTSVQFVGDDLRGCLMGCAALYGTRGERGDVSPG